MTPIVSNQMTIGKKRMRYNRDLHHRRSIRLKGYDYRSAGAYAVTTCVNGRELSLGRVVDGEMELSDLGRVAAESWTWLEEQYPYVSLDAWVVMPNHLHGIIVIHDDDGDGGRGGSRTAPTKRKPLGRLIGAFKTVSTKRINQVRDTPGARFWQRNYYEKIIRNERQLHALRRYIMDNPRQWALDSENPASHRERNPDAI
jgi:REP element-mobilizing transposase RayT